MALTDKLTNIANAIREKTGSTDTMNLEGMAAAVTNIKIPTALSDLNEDETHRTVTDAEKKTWNNKSDFSGNYDDLKNKPTIPTIPEQLAGTTDELTPTQVYNAVSAGIPVKVQYTDSTYGLISFTAFTVSESQNVIASSMIAYYNSVYILTELVGHKSNNTWGFNTTTLAQKTDIPAALPNPNALTFTGAVEGSYDGSAPLSVEIPGGGGAAVETWDLLINAEIAEDCTEVIFNSGDAGEVLSNYKELLLLIDLFGNTGEFTSGLKIGFLNAVRVWHSPYALQMTGYSAETVKYYINMFRFKKTEYGILPVNRYTQYNTGSMSDGLSHASGTTSSSALATDFILPISPNQHVTTDMTDFISQKEFERLVIGGYQAVIGAGTIIKVWGMK